MNSNTFYISKRNRFGGVILILFYGLLLLTAISLLGCGGNDNVDLAEPEGEEAAQTGDNATIDDLDTDDYIDYDPDVIASLDADYYIDYKGGTIPIGDLPIGARVVDPSWEWEFRTGDDYSGSGDVKPVTWLIVAKDHYDGLEPHVTLLSEELIGKYAFDNSTNRGSQNGSSHWGESGTSNATRGLRSWLNSTGINEGEGFYWAFSRAFKGAVLETVVPNKEWKNGTDYSTSDYVFIPSLTEQGDGDSLREEYVYQIGSTYPYFSSAGNVNRASRLSEKIWYYWTRTPVSAKAANHRVVNSAGEIDFIFSVANGVASGVRPALNLKSGILVSEIKK